MPPSPSSRRSPVRELRVENAHRRGQSIEGRFSLKSKDEDLVLFNEMQNHERDNFLLHSFDDFDDSIIKLRYFPDFKLGINIPQQGESCGLLNADSEKNDYDWLLTPPDTPLFPSLDDEEPQPVNVSRGRTMSQTISVSRTSMCEKTLRPNRSSASPCRLSPSSRSSYSAAHSRTRSSSTPRSSPPPVLRTTTPLRRSSTPPKHSPAPRSLTPTSRRSSTGSIGQAFSGKRGASPVSTNRGNSASPKLRGWQSSIPGFSADAPPNLRTSMTDRSVSCVRGSSPIRGIGRVSASKFGRKSVSPSPSRSASSSHNSERDHCSSISKQSAPSSCEDDAESYSSLGVSSNATTKSYGVYANSRAMVFSKKPSRSPSASSAPKRSFDSALRQMDRHKAPHNMFRPLLSSVPAATICVGKTNNAHRPMFSRNSSLTASSYASSEHGVAPDLEDGEHDQSNLTGEQEKIKDSEFQEEMFIFDKLDEVSEDTDHDASCAKLHGGNKIFNVSVPEKINSELEYPCDGCGAMKNTAVVYQVPYAAEYPKAESAKTMKPCLKCGKRFIITAVDVDVCEDCSVMHGIVRPEEPETTQLAPPGVRNAAPGPMVHPVLGMPEYSDNPSTARSSQSGQSSGQRASGSALVNNQRNQKVSEQNLFTPSEFDALESSSNYQSHVSEPNPRLIDCVDNSEGTGIAVLLKHGSGGRKWPVVQGKAFSATNILFAESSYGRDKINTMKCTFGKDSSSASSSVDMGSYGQTEGRLMWQLSSTKPEIENVGGKSQDCSMHSETPNTAIEATVCSRIESDAVSCSVVRSFETDAIKERLVDARETDSYFGDKDLNASEHVTEQAIDCPGTQSASSGLLLKSSQSLDFQMCETSVTNNPVESCDSCENTEIILDNSGKDVPEIGAQISTLDSSFIDNNHMLSDPGCPNDISDVATHESSAVILDRQNDIIGNFQEAHSGCLSSQAPNCLEDFQDVLISTTSEVTVTTEAPRKSVQRSFTLEEATDTILFCSSIVHDMAYNAATIAMENESILYESSHRPVTFMGSSISNHNLTRKASNKSIQNSRKNNRKKLETANKMQPVELGDNVKTSDFPSCNTVEIPQTVDSVKLPPKLESKCNCTVM